MNEQKMLGGQLDNGKPKAGGMIAAVGFRFKRDAETRPDATRGRGQVQVVPKPRWVARCEETVATRWRVLRTVDGWRLTRPFATTSPTRPHVAAFSCSSERPPNANVGHVCDDAAAWMLGPFHNPLFATPKPTRLLTQRGLLNQRPARVLARIGRRGWLFDYSSTDGIKPETSQIRTDRSPTPRVAKIGIAG